MSYLIEFWFRQDVGALPSREPLASRLSAVSKKHPHKKKGGLVRPAGEFRYPKGAPRKASGLCPRANHWLLACPP